MNHNKDLYTEIGQLKAQIVSMQAEIDDIRKSKSTAWNGLWEWLGNFFTKKISYPNKERLQFIPEGVNMSDLFFQLKFNLPKIQAYEIKKSLNVSQKLTPFHRITMKLNLGFPSFSRMEIPIKELDTAFFLSETQIQQRQNELDEILSSQSKLIKEIMEQEKVRINQLAKEKFLKKIRRYGYKTI